MAYDEDDLAITEVATVEENRESIAAYSIGPDFRQDTFQAVLLPDRGLSAGHSKSLFT